MDNDVCGSRIQRLREGLLKKNLEGCIIKKRENVRYLSGFGGTEGVLLITHGSRDIIVDSRYSEQASKEVVNYRVNSYKGNIIDFLKILMDSLKIKSVGFEEDTFTYKDYAEYSKKLEEIEMKSLEGLAEDLRIIKDFTEEQLVKKAVQIADSAFSKILSLIKPGTIEKDIAAELEYIMKKEGADKESFETIVASGLRSSMPHGVASEKKIQPGDAITIDFGAIYRGYCSDITRTVFLGTPSTEMIKIYNTVLKAKNEAEKLIRPEEEGKSADIYARNIINEAGFGDYFGHGLGHGVGLEIHEAPRLSPSSTSVLKTGMIFTVEPGIYIEGLGGVRIEDTVIMRENGIDILTKSDESIIIL